MMDRSPQPPEALLRAIAQDLRPVKPSPKPFRMALRLIPLALVVSSAVLLAIGPRHDFRTIGPLLTWGASAAQFVLAIALVWIAAHEGTPAGRLPKRMVNFAALAAGLVVAAITLLTFSTSPTNETSLSRLYHLPVNVSPWIMASACGIGSTVAGGILVLFFSLVFRQSLAARPAVAGALYGAGAGLAINAGWRVACPISAPWHALGAHGAAIVATVAVGALVGRSLARRRRQVGGSRF